MIPVQKPGKQAPLKTLSFHEWLKGRRSDTDVTRTDNAALSVTDDVTIEQDGIIAPRPATIPFGTQPNGAILGIDDFTKIVSGVPESWLITMQSVGGVGKVYVNKDGGSWTECTGKTYALAEANFVQAAGKVLIMNGTDYLSYLDTTTLTITSFNALTTVGTPTATPTGMSGTSLTYRFRVTAVSDVGETNASVAATVTTSIARSEWTQTGATPHYVSLSWSAVAGAKGYCIYVGTEVDKEVFIGTTPSTTTSYVDDGTAIEIVTKVAPKGNSTQGPIVKRGANVGGQVFLVGDGYKVWYGGSGEYSLDFSPFNGGGFISPADGSKYVPVSVIPFRDRTGQPMATVFSSGMSSVGKITHLSTQSMNFGDTVITYMQADEANAQDGTSSPSAIAQTRDSLWYPSADTFKTTGTKPQVQNLLSTDNISDGVSEDMKQLNQKFMSKASVAVMGGKIHWALPVGAEENSQIWTLDLVRGGQWMLPWRIAAKKLLVHGTNDGVTHLLAVVGNTLVEFTRSRATEDNGVAFPTKAASGYIKSGKSGFDWMYVVDVTFVLINPQGDIQLSLQAKTKDTPLAKLADKSYQPQFSYAGWGEIMSGASSYWGEVAWGQVISTPTSFGASRVVKTISVKKPVNFIQWIIETSTKGAYYQLSDVIIRYADIGPIITEEMRR